MNKSHIKLLGLSSLLLLLSSCSGLQFDRYLDLKVVNGDNVIYESKINIFNNAILPDAPTSSDSSKVFVGFGATEFVPHVSKKKDFYAAKDLVRYNDVKKYAVNNVVTLNSIFANSDEIAKNYLVLGWYGKTSTSGLNTDIMDGFKPMLMNFLESNGATKEQLKDVEIRCYEGDVATIGGNITFDGDVDIFLGAGVNLGTTGGVAYLQRNSYEIKGAADRYIYRLTDTEQCNAVYTWMRTAEIKNYFRGK